MQSVRIEKYAISSGTFGHIADTVRKEATMSTALQDPTLPRDPAAPHGFSEIEREPELRAPRTLAEEVLAEFHDGAAASETPCELAPHRPVG
jgi:hypothetical protein